LKGASLKVGAWNVVLGRGRVQAFEVELKNIAVRKVNFKPSINLVCLIVFHSAMQHEILSTAACQLFPHSSRA
jgi:hypothetical protein